MVCWLNGNDSLNMFRRQTKLFSVTSCICFFFRQLCVVLHWIKPCQKKYCHSHWETFARATLITNTLLGQALYIWIFFYQLYLLDGLVDGSKSWLLVIVENSSVTMENEDTGLLRLFTVAAIDAVVWTVVPLAGEHIQALWNTTTSEAESRWMTRTHLGWWIRTRLLRLLANSSGTLSLPNSTSVNVAARAWIVVKYDVKKVLVPPCNIQFVLLEEWQQDFLPAQSSCSHVILDGNKHITALIPWNTKNPSSLSLRTCENLKEWQQRPQLVGIGSALTLLYWALLNVDQLL